MTITYKLNDEEKASIQRYIDAGDEQFIKNVAEFLANQKDVTMVSYSYDKDNLYVECSESDQTPADAKS